MNFSGNTSGKNLACQHTRCKRHGFDPWVRKIPWSRNWQLPLVFLSRKSVDRGAWRGYSRWGHKESDTNEQLNSKTKILHGDDCFSWLAETSRDHRNVLPLSVQSVSSVAQSCPNLCNPMGAARQASLSITNSWSLLKLMSIELAMPSNHLILWRSLLVPPSIFPSIRIFSSESVLHIRWPKY